MVKYIFYSMQSSFSNGCKRLPENPPDCPILCSLVFDNFILADEPLEKHYEDLKLVY